MSNLTSPEPADSPIDSASQARYRVWKKNTPFLYDYVSTHSLLWPSLTVQFFPDLEGPKSDGKHAPEYVVQRLLLGTFTAGQAADSLSISQLSHYQDLANGLSSDKVNYNHEKEEFELSTVPKRKLTTVQTIGHHGDVNRARYMPQNPDVLAASSSHGDLLIYDRTKHASFATDDVTRPQVSLVSGSLVDIYAFDWNSQNEGVIVAGNVEGAVDVYDIQQQFTARDAGITSKHTYSHPSGINDVEWVPGHDSVFAVADEDRNAVLYDTRAGMSVLSHSSSLEAANSISFNRLQNSVFATGDSGGETRVWDLRNLQESLFSVHQHTDAITQLKWHPTLKSVFGTSSNDKLVRLYDLGRQEDSGLVFVHGGHMLGVNDFDWSLHEPWMVASVGNDNSLHVWQPSKRQ